MHRTVLGVGTAEATRSPKRAAPVDGKTVEKPQIGSMSLVVPNALPFTMRPLGNSGVKTSSVSSDTPPLVSHSPQGDLMSA